MANAVLRSLNWLAGTDGFGRHALWASTPVSTDMQDTVRARALDIAVSAQAEEEAIGPDARRTPDEEALRGLLRGRGSYNVVADAANNLPAFDPLRVALPSDVKDAPTLASLLPSDAAHFLEVESRMLRPEDEQALIGGGSPTKPYVDPKLKGSRRLQIAFAKHLLDIWLFRVTRQRMGTVGVF